MYHHSARVRLGLVLVAVLGMMVLVGCGSSSSSSSSAAAGGGSSSSSSSASSSASGSVDTSKCGPKPGVKATGTPINIGTIDTKQPGTDFSDGPNMINAYFACVNANGGVNEFPHADNNTFVRSIFINHV